MGTDASLARRAARICAVVVFALVASVVHAGEQRFQLLLDTDNNAATGCTVPTSKAKGGWVGNFTQF
jgi:hypothetical protein